MIRILAITLVALMASSATPLAQPPARRATTIEAVRLYPGFFHSQAVVIVGDVSLVDATSVLQSESGSLRLVGRERPVEGAAEVSGVIYDIGRMNSDDPRIMTLGVREQIHEAYGERWPRPGEELVLHVSAARAPSPPVSSTAPPIRSIALTPERYVGERITISGQFRGRNLYADIPDTPLGERTDFVLRSGDAALWITGLRPRGAGFNFDPTRRVDTGRWVRVTGTVRHGRGLVWLEATKIELGDPPTEEATEVQVPLPPPAPLEVIFSSPTEGEPDASPDAVIRVQFSRDVDPATLKNRVQLSYAAPDPVAAGEPENPAIAFALNYTGATRGLEIRPARPLGRFRQVRLELLEGIQGPDGAMLAPFTLTFSTGGA